MRIVNVYLKVAKEVNLKVLIMRKKYNYIVMDVN